MKSKFLEATLRGFRLLAIAALLTPLSLEAQDTLSLQPIAQIPSSEILFATPERLITVSRCVDMDYYDTLYTIDISSPYEPRILMQSSPLATYLGAGEFSKSWHSDALLLGDVVIVGVNYSSYYGHMPPERQTTGPLQLVSESITDRRRQVFTFMDAFMEWDSTALDSFGGPLPRYAFPSEMAKIGDLLFYNTGTWGLKVFDFSDPFHPTELESLPYTCRGLQASGDLLMIELDSSLVGLNYTDPDFPEEIWRIDLATEEFPYVDPILYEGYIFFHHELRLFPDAPDIAVLDAWGEAGQMELGRYDLGLPVSHYEFAASGNRLFARRGSEVRAFNLEEGYIPRFWKQVRLAEGAFSFAAAGRLLFLSPDERGCPGPTWANVYDIEENSISPDYSLTPHALSLSSFPNPFNSSTTIEYSLPRPGRYALSVVDITGREVARLADGWKAAGSYREVWKASGMAGGTYFIRVGGMNKLQVKPVELVR
jgi:hypothetical protein